MFVEVDKRAEGGKLSRWVRVGTGVLWRNGMGTCLRPLLAGGIELEGSSGPVFETDTLLRIETGEMRKCETESGLMSLEATYDELTDQKFVIRCIHRPPCCKCENCECGGLGTICRESRGLCREEVPIHTLFTHSSLTIGFVGVQD